MRGLRGLRSHLATFRRDTITADEEGNPSGTSEVIWQGRGIFKSTGAEADDDRAGRPNWKQRADFRCRPSQALLTGDYCQLRGVIWSVEAVEVTAQATVVMLVTPPATPFH